MISLRDVESVMETLDVLADTAAMRDVEQWAADAEAGRHLTGAEMDEIMTARHAGVAIGDDDVDLVADMHARGLPDAVCFAALEALTRDRRGPAREGRSPGPGAC